MLLLKCALMLLTCQQFTVSVAPAVPQFTVSVAVTAAKPEQAVKAARPRLRISTTTNCQPCQRLHRDIDAGLFSDFEIEYYDDQNWSGGYPVIRFEQDGKWRHLVDRRTKNNRGYDSSVLADLKTVLLQGVKAEILDESRTVQKSAEVPGRYAMWDGEQYDFERWSPCSSGRCEMCRNLRPKYNNYWAMKSQAGYHQTSLDADIPDHQQPTPDDVIDRMLPLLNLTSADVLGELGCGNARIMIAAAERYGCRGIGIEIDPAKADEARQNVEAAGLSDRIEILTGDALDFSPREHGVTAIVAYLYPELLAKLAPKFREVRIAASPFHAVPGLAMTEHDDVWIYQNEEKLK